MSAFSYNVRRYRIECGLSCAEIAAKLRIPINTVKSWECCGVKQPRGGLGPVAAILGVTPADLLEAPPGAGGVCDVWRICISQLCGESPALPFAARCACGHDMAGLACAACRGSVKPGCLTCWNEKQHKCAITFLAAELAGAK